MNSLSLASLDTAPGTMTTQHVEFLAQFLRCIVLLHMCCIIVTRWGGPGKIEA